MPNAAEIHSHLADWLQGKISLSQFEDWFVPATWDIHKANDPEAESLVDEIELRLSEYSGRYLALERLREELRDLANSIDSLPWIESAENRNSEASCLPIPGFNASSAEPAFNQASAR
jgi:hypothetical protein